MHQIEGKPVHFREDGLSISAYLGEIPVGRIKSVDNGDGTILLSDVDVNERIEVKRGMLARGIRRVLPDWGIVFPRRNGIGNELLERFIRACERAGKVEIYGNVTPDADAAQPFLRGWYESFGFAVSPPDGRDECIPTRYKVIRKRQKEGVPETYTESSRIIP